MQQALQMTAGTIHFTCLLYAAHTADIRHIANLTNMNMIHTSHSVFGDETEQWRFGFSTTFFFWKTHCFVCRFFFARITENTILLFFHSSRLMLLKMYQWRWFGVSIVFAINSVNASENRTRKYYFSSSLKWKRLDDSHTHIYCHSTFKLT